MRTYGLIGLKLGHSHSSEWFTNFFHSNSIDAKYHLFELDNIDKLPELVRNTDNLAGLNITVPYKKDVLLFCNKTSEEVKYIGATNCISVQNGSLIAHNTDVYGFEYLLSLIKGWNHLSGAMILGTGGAAAAVRYVFEKLNFPLVFISRTKVSDDVLLYEHIDAQILNRFPLVVNCTPVGMHPETGLAPPFPYKILTGKEIFVDIIYNPAETLFLKRGKKYGCKVFNGLSMFNAQAERSWHIWNNCV